MENDTECGRWEWPKKLCKIKLKRDYAGSAVNNHCKLRSLIGLINQILCAWEPQNSTDDKIRKCMHKWLAGQPPIPNSPFLSDSLAPELGS